MRMRQVALMVAVCFCFSLMLAAQDAVKVDPDHYKVVTENDKVRVLKVHYGAHEKSKMHSHPAAVAVFLTNAKGKFTFPDGKTQDMDMKAGDSMYTEAMTHMPENPGDEPFDVVVIELKGKAGHSKSEKQ